MNNHQHANEYKTNATITTHGRQWLNKLNG